tara:strand:+ start:2033 stop:2413 length:381 start_codon:yes stop_codon:yes gene_type:complete
MSSDEENDEIKCLKCNKVIDEKPWITIRFNEGCNVYGCSYLCANQFRELIGFGYWNYIVNKEDFNEPRPVFGYTNRLSKGDITTGFGMTQITEEVQNEINRIEMIEEEYYYDSSSDEDNYDYYYVK